MMAEPKDDILRRLNGPFTYHAGSAGVWGHPGDPDTLRDEPAQLAPAGFDYSAGVIVGVHDEEATAYPSLEPILIRRQTDVPPSYEVAHEATHRRFEPPVTVAVSQAAPGFSLVAAPLVGLHYIKVLSAFLTLDAAGTLKFVQGSADGLSSADMTGAVSLGGAAAPAFQLPPAETSTPWFFSSPDQALGIFTTTGKAQGFVTFCYSPYEA